MPVTIEIPTAFRRFTDGAPKVDCSAATVSEALDALTTRFPALSHTSATTGPDPPVPQRVPQRRRHPFPGRRIRPLKEGDRVLLVPSIAGG